MIVGIGSTRIREVLDTDDELPPLRTTDHYIRVVGFNAEKQVQMASFIVHKPE